MTHNLSAWGQTGGPDCRRVADRLEHLAWRPSLEQIESAVAKEFGVELSQLFVKRLKNHEARVAAIVRTNIASSYLVEFEESEVTALSSMLFTSASS